MYKYYSGKVAQYILILIFTITLNFLLPRMMPGDPLKYIVGEDILALTQQQREDILEQHGLDKPVYIQYVNYLKNLLKGDLGYSYKAGKPVKDMIAEKLPWTLLLSFINIVLTTIIGVILGTLAAWNRGKPIDVGINSVLTFCRSMPSFWIAMILIAIFGSTLGWLPVYGAKTMWESYTGASYVLDVAKHLILPTVTLLILSLSSTFMTMRYSMIDTLGEDYITMAKIKGLPDKKIRYKHAMRNALIPVVTTVMMDLGYMVGGATIIETVFSYPGTGRLLFEALTGRDYPLIQGCFLIITICVIAANIIADMIYPLIDPKVV